MKLIIDISEEEYEKNKLAKCDYHTLRMAIKNGTPLPKGHGDLVDSKDAIETLQIMFSKDEDIQNACEQCILDCPIIIEADKGE